jgi:hypothetical protein
VLSSTLINELNRIIVVVAAAVTVVVVVIVVVVVQGFSIVLMQLNNA